MSFLYSVGNLLSHFFYSIPETLVNYSQSAIVSYLCLNLAVTPIFIACQTQLMLSVFAVLFFFINTALLLITLGLEYLGLAVLLVYAGAIIMILLFVIMLVKLQETEEQPFSLLVPSRWSASLLPFQSEHIKTRSIFLITVIILGASLLTYSCKSLVTDIQPPQVLSVAPALTLFSEFGKVPLFGQNVTTNLGVTQLPAEAVFINVFDNQYEPNHIPWLHHYFSDRLEHKFQPLVLEDRKTGYWESLAFVKAPSYNLDRFMLNLLGQFGHLNSTLPAYKWVQLLTINDIPGTGSPLSSLQKLGNPALTLQDWTFYPRTRLGVYEFPLAPIQQLQANAEIPLIYSLESEFKDMFPLPHKDISTISSVLYTLHAPTLVLAAICLFVAMVLSFLLTDFKMKS